jgi:hypothetical protein
MLARTLDSASSARLRRDVARSVKELLIGQRVTSLLAARLERVSLDDIGPTHNTRRLP